MPNRIPTSRARSRVLQFLGEARVGSAKGASLPRYCNVWGPSDNQDDKRSRPWPVYHPNVAAGDLVLCEKAFSYSYCENTLTTNLWSVIALKGTGAKPRY